MGDSTGEHCENPIRLLEYQPGRGGKYPQEFLKGFNGYLHTDAYAGYEKASGVIRCLCWMHLRRYFRDALPKDLKSSEATLPSQGIKFCNELFKIEKALAKLVSEKRKSERLKQEKPVLDDFWDGNCSISNNLAENSIRPFTIGRKNWLFSGSPKGAAASATVYSIIESAKTNGLNPYKYLCFLFEQMPGVLFKQYPEFLEDYLTWNPIIQARCK